MHSLYREGVFYRAHYGYGPTVLLLDGHGDLGMRHKAIDLQQFRQFVLELKLRQTPGLHLDGDQGYGYKSRIIHADVPRQFWHIEDFHA